MAWGGVALGKRGGPFSTPPRTPRVSHRGGQLTPCPPARSGARPHPRDSPMKRSKVGSKEASKQWFFLHVHDGPDWERRSSRSKSGGPYCSRKEACEAALEDASDYGLDCNHQPSSSATCSIKSSSLRNIMSSGFPRRHSRCEQRVPSESR